MFIAEVAWQYGFAGEEFGWIEHGRTFEIIGTSFSVVRDSGLLWLVIVFVILGALLLFVLQPWIHATLILSIRQKFAQPERRLSLRKKIFEGHTHFVQLLEYHALLMPFSFVSIMFYAISFYRYTHGGDTYFSLVLPSLLILGVISIFVHFFLIFMPFFLVCEKQEFFKSMTHSVGLVFLHFGKTVSLFLVMILVSLRVVVNTLVIIGVPLGLISIGTYFATSNFYSIFLIFAGIISLFLIAGTGYLTSILEVFAVSFWYKAFQVFRAADAAEEAGEVSEVLESSKELTIQKPKEQFQEQQTVKVVHVVHHVQVGASMPDPSTFTDIPGEITEIQEEPPLPIEEKPDVDSFQQ